MKVPQDTFHSNINKTHQQKYFDIQHQHSTPCPNDMIQTWIYKIKFPVNNALSIYLFLFYRDQSSITWFTACDNFNGVEDQFNFEVCLAGIEDKRLFYDEHHDIFMALDTNDKIENRHYPMNMNMIGNKATKQFEKASISCSMGNLNTGRSHVRIGAATILDLAE